MQRIEDPTMHEVHPRSFDEQSLDSPINGIKGVRQREYRICTTWHVLAALESKRGLSNEPIASRVGETAILVLISDERRRNIAEAGVDACATTRSSQLIEIPNAEVNNLYRNALLCQHMLQKPGSKRRISVTRREWRDGEQETCGTVCVQR